MRQWQGSSSLPSSLTYGDDCSEWLLLNLVAGAVALLPDQLEYTKVTSHVGKEMCLGLSEGIWVFSILVSCVTMIQLG